jgi:hypothetical protein
MWPWIKRWRDWAMHNVWTTPRTGPQPQALHYSYEKAGLTLHDQPIPWNAEAVVVEGMVRLGPNLPRRKADFQLHLPWREPIPAENLRRQDGEDRYRVWFRLPPPAQPVVAELFWRNSSLGQVRLPVLGREEFVRNLQLQMPTLFVRLGSESVACQTFVSTQCRGLMASAVITSPTSLVPLLDLGLQVEFHSERTGQAHAVPVRLCSSQLAGRQALLTVIPRRFPRRIGTWAVNWKLGGLLLASQQVRAISQRHFQRSLRVCDTRFVVQLDKAGMSLMRHVPPLDGPARVGPCFLVGSSEPGMAGLCTLQVRAQVAGAVTPPVLMEEEALITDGPTPFAPGTLDYADVKQLSAFELRCKRGVLGTLSLCPAPTAAFNSEGGFKNSEEFSWSNSAEDELNDRLARLFEIRNNGG